MNTSSKRTIFLSVLVVIAAHAPALASPATLPRAHRIEGVINHKQITGLHCGPAAVESMMDYWGPDISQRELANVARTSSEGTWSFDMVRAGHFSSLSAAQGSFYQNDIPAAGYTARGRGYAAFGHAAQTPWFEELKGLVAQDIPVLLLMWFSPQVGSGGHYRVLVGYDDDLGELYFVDPWDRNLGKVTNPDGTVTWTYAEFAIGWNYVESGLGTPYFGTVHMPWKIQLTASGPKRAGTEVVVSADITYPCPAPFDCSRFPASNANAEIVLPQGMHLVSGHASTSLGNLSAGSRRTVSWRVAIDSSSAGANITVTAGGLVSGAVPEAYWSSEQKYYPAYSYTDLIGGEARLTL